MIKKIIIKIKRIFLIYKNNLKYNCDISLGASIDEFSVFEGRNIVYSKAVIVKSEIGYATYISGSCSFPKTKIGRYCSIASNVKIIAGNHPTTEYISTHPLFYSNKAFSGLFYEHTNVFNEFSYTDESERYLCEIGNDVWIGEHVKIINGICIGDGAIIAAGAVVSRNVPPYAVVGGVPAKVIKYRFKEDDIVFLLNFKWWNKDEEWIKKHAKHFSDIDIIKVDEESNESIK